MRWLLLGLLLCASAAFGQTTNPPTGSVWTYQGPTLGAGWAPPVINVVTSCGAKGDDTTDDTTAIQNCINGLPAQGGAIVFPSSYTFKTTGTITIGNGSSAAASTRSGVMLRGDGNAAGGMIATGPYNQGGPIIDYQGSGDAIEIAGPLYGWGLDGLHIKCTNSTATNGLHVLSAGWGDSRNLRIGGCSTQLLSNTLPTMPPGFGVIDSLHNHYQNIVLELSGASSTGLVLDGDGLTSPKSDTDFNQIDNLIIFVSPSATGTVHGIIFRVCDNNVLKQVEITAWGGGSYTTIPVLYDYTINNIYPLGNVIDTIDAGQMGGNDGRSNFINAGAPNTNATPNMLAHMQRTNGGNYPIGLPGLIMDYGTDVWQPLVSGSTTAGTPTYTSQNAIITENGMNVTIHADVAISALGGAAGNILFRGFPVTTDNDPPVSPVCAVGSWGGFKLDAGYSGITALIQPNSNQAAFSEFGSGGNSQILTWANNTISGGFYFNITCTFNRLEGSFITRGSVKK